MVRTIIIFKFQIIIALAPSLFILTSSRFCNKSQVYNLQVYIPMVYNLKDYTLYHKDCPNFIPN